MDNLLILKTPLVWIPPGSFTMGSPQDEVDRQQDENSVPVTLSRGFCLGRYVVTQKQWWRLMRTTPWGHDDRVMEGNEYPATCVSWDDAMEFCEKLTQRQQSAGVLPSDWKYTLPTEAQWEYACRAGTKSRYSFGDDQRELGDYGRCYENAGDAREGYANAVGQKHPNRFGLYDMHGNVWEWCLDYYDEKLAEGMDPQGASHSSWRVRRGGSWNERAGLCRSAHRSRAEPEDGFNPEQGFRVAVVWSEM